MKMKELILKENLSYKKTQELRKQRDEFFNKAKFLKQLNIAIERNSIGV